MQSLKNALKWTMIIAAFLLIVGLLTMTGDKPPEDMDMGAGTPGGTGQSTAPPSAPN